MELSALQSTLWRLIVAPTGAVAGAAELCAEGVIESPDLEGLVCGDERLGAVERVDVYADMYFYRLRDCLAEDFPRLAQTLGEVDFHNLVTDYLLAHPSRHWSLREVGRALPGFLESHTAAVADLAALEWARVDVFDAADAEPLTREDLIAGGAASRLCLVPAVRLLRVGAGALRAWQGSADEGAQGECAVRVWRRGFGVQHCGIEADEEGCLRALASAGGATLGELGERVDAAQRLAALLEVWTRDGLLASVDAGRPGS